MKAAIIVLSDPKNGGEEALGRVFNALATAYDFAKRDVPVKIYFQGTGTRWPVELEKLEHPVNGLFVAVQQHVVGVSCGCADVFGARADAEKSGFSVVTDNAVPGTTGLPSLGQLTLDGYDVFTF
jgi:hypothetical protein